MRAEEEQPSAMGGLERAAPFNGQFRKRDLRESIVGDIRVKVVAIDFDGRPDLTVELHIFLPSSSPLQDQQGKIPAVYIAPAGSNMLTGKSPETGDYPECLPWAKAGFAVVLYSLAGSPDHLGHPPGEAELNDCFQKFRQADAGIVNYNAARSAWTVADVINPHRSVVVGHSSASIVALLAAESDPSVAACVVFGTVPDVAEALGANLGPLEAKLPGVVDFARHYSPERYVKDLRCPLFVFHAEDDPLAPINRVQRFVDRAKPHCPQVEFVRVPTGGHGEGMLREGIPLAIKWASSLDLEPPWKHHRPAEQPIASGKQDRKPKPIPAQPNRGEMAGGRQGDFGLGGDKPEKKLTDRIKGAVTFKPAAVGNLVAARLIVGPDDKLAKALRRSPGLGRPLVSMRFVVGATGLDEASHRGADDQGGAMRDFCKGGGDFATRLLEGMLARAESGSFGEWASDAPAFDKQRPNCVLFANDFSQQGLEMFAANQKADVLVSLNFTSKAAGRKNRVVTLVIHVVDVARNSEIWASQPLTSTALRAGRSKGEDPGLELINELLKYLDEDLALEPAAQLSADEAVLRAEQLVADPTQGTMAKLAELRAYQCQKLLTEEQARGYYAQLLDEARAEQLASDDPTLRFEAIADLIPEH